ncbi:hypothetical protein IWX47DRAFT_379864 [Phyllosticta citricarpa]
MILIVLCSASATACVVKHLYSGIFCVTQELKKEHQSKPCGVVEFSRSTYIQAGSMSASAHSSVCQQHHCVPTSLLAETGWHRLGHQVSQVPVFHQTTDRLRQAQGKRVRRNMTAETRLSRSGSDTCLVHSILYTEPSSPRVATHLLPEHPGSKLSFMRVHRPEPSAPLIPSFRPSSPRVPRVMHMADGLPDVTTPLAFLSSTRLQPTVAPAKSNG